MKLRAASLAWLLATSSVLVGCVSAPPKSTTSPSTGLQPSLSPTTVVSQPVTPNQQPSNNISIQIPTATKQQAPSVSNIIIGFVGARQNDSDYSFFVMNINNTNQTRLAPALMASKSSEAWSPGKTILAYQDRDFPSRKQWFSLVDTNGENQRKVTDLAEFLPWSWSWSADEKSLIMLCPTGGQAKPKPEGGIDERHYFDIFTMNLNTGELKRLTDTKDIGKESPLCSPDGKKIAFSGAEHDPVTWNVISNGIYTLNMDGSGQVRLFSSPRLIYTFQWSPDSMKIVYSSYDEKKGPNSADIYVLDIATGVNTNLTNSSDIGDFDPSWSPDGRKIAFCSGVIRQGYHLRVMNADGTSVENLYKLPDYPEGFPCWSPDGKNILFTDRHVIYSVGKDGSNIRTLLDGKGIFRDIIYPVWLSK